MFNHIAQMLLAQMLLAQMLLAQMLLAQMLLAQMLLANRIEGTNNILDLVLLAHGKTREQQGFARQTLLLWPLCLSPTWIECREAG
jgi:hypothetical protein